MGYRSDVTLVFYTRMPTAMAFPVLKLWFDENYPVHDATEDWGATVETGSEWVKISYHDVKWYEGYSHVTAVNAALDKFDETFDASGTDTVAWEFMRVGEETADIESRYSTYSDWRLGVRREVYFD